MDRYVAIILSSANPASTRAFLELRRALTSMTDWATAFSGPFTHVVHALRPGHSSSGCALRDGSGVILGWCTKNTAREYERNRNATLFDEEQTAKIVTSGGQYLVDNYWGSYVAIIYDKADRRHHIFSDPSGAIPTYRLKYRGVQIFFSHAADCARLVPVQFSANRSYLTRWLIFSGYKGRECGLEGVEHLTGGERLSLDANGTSRKQLWNVLTLARDCRIERPDLAAQELRAAVENSVSTWAARYRTITQRLSGGLDSSILAGCLAHAPSKPNVFYLNLSADVGVGQERIHLPGIDAHTVDRIRATTGMGDERHFARLVAQRWNTRLIERERDICMDLRRLRDVELTTSPPLFWTVMELEDIEIQLSKELGTEAIFSGQGGDSVFLATMEPFPAIDYAYLHGMSRGFWHHVFSSTALSKNSLWSVLGNTVRHGFMRRPWSAPAGFLNSPHLLKDETVDSLREGDFEGYWSDCSTGMPPGKHHHFLGLDGTDYYDYVFHSHVYCDHVDPFNSQPVWETALRIPTYTLLDGGVSRGLVRRAFADLLPREIRRRQSKGTGTPFYQRVVRDNVRVIGEWLLDGYLARERYLDRGKLEKCLSAPEPFLFAAAGSILAYLSAEVWLRRVTTGASDNSNICSAVPAPAHLSH